MSSKYKNGKIYKIVSDDLIGICYIGSTVQSLSNRMAGHRVSYKSYLKRNIGYTSSFELLKTGNAIIYLIEDYPCTTKTELERREGELIRQYRFDPTCEMVCNRAIAGRTKKEYHQDNKVKLNLHSKQYHQANKVKCNLQRKQHYQANKEKRKLRDKQYHQDNKEKIRLRRKQYREANKEKISLRSKQHREANKEQLKEQRSKPVVCPHCSRTVQRCSIARHQKSKRCKSHQ